MHSWDILIRNLVVSDGFARPGYLSETQKNRTSTFSNKPNTQTLGFWQSGDHCQKPVGL
jgi:hypothetical protein